jgi:hypothetical protein
LGQIIGSIPEEGTDNPSRNFGKKLPLLAAKTPQEVLEAMEVSYFKVLKKETFLTAYKATIGTRYL